MQDGQSSQRVLHIIKELEELWQFPQEPTPNELTQITEFIVGLQEPYKTIGLQKIAEHTLSNMSLHVLATMALFYKKATEEGISLKNRDETLNHVNPQTFRILEELNKHLSINSLDDLVAFSNITTGLQTLSKVNSAEEAQSWLYDLPTMYQQQLTQEKLLVNTTTFTLKAANEGVVQVKSSPNWYSYDLTSGLSKDTATGFAVGPGIIITSAHQPIASIPTEVIFEPSKKVSFQAA